MTPGQDSGLLLRPALAPQMPDHGWAPAMLGGGPRQLGRLGDPSSEQGCFLTRRETFP